MKKLVIIILLFITIITIGIMGFFWFHKKSVMVFLNGQEEIVVPVFSNYIDEGVVVKLNNKVITNDKYNLKINGSVDNQKIGDYIIKYNINYKNKNYELFRKIVIIDDIAPELTINTESVVKDYCSKKIKTKIDYQANDNYDGDITKQVMIEEQEEKMVLKAIDSSGNITIKEVPIVNDKKPNNSFLLNGNQHVYVVLGGTYNESGAKYIDGCGNKIDAKIEISGEVDTSKEGDYQLTYTLNGNQKLSRTVTVYEKSSSSNANKVIYLTFDDGPGYYTKSILNTLDKYNVKATFFVTNQFPSYIELIKDEHEKGHTVAVHTYSHKYSIYKSVDSYLEDFNKINNVIKKYTGSTTNLFRFPGGSSNTVSKNYKIGIMSELANKMNQDGYVYFDWNVDSTDAAGSGSSKIYRSVINGVKSCSKCVVLMHDIHGTTASALDSILNALVNEGYTFAALNESSFTAHHGINN